MFKGTCVWICLVAVGGEWELGIPRLPPSAGCQGFAFK